MNGVLPDPGVVNLTSNILRQGQNIHRTCVHVAHITHLLVVSKLNQADWIGRCPDTMFKLDQLPTPTVKKTKHIFTFRPWMVLRGSCTVLRLFWCYL